MVKYYTLEEAAKLLRLSPDKLREMANKKQIRAFQDRGTLRFRAEDIEERVRALGLGSDPELPIGEAPAPRSSASPLPLKKKSSKIDPILFEDDSDEVSLDLDPAKSAGPASGRSLGGRSTRSPRPAGNDSDVRLSIEGLDFPAEEAPKSTKSKGGTRKPKSKLEKQSDSDVKIDPEDSTVPLGVSKSKSPSDSDIRLEDLPSMAGAERKKPQIVTEEIDLDAEQMKAPKQSPPSKTKPKTKAPVQHSPVLPTTSPFELSEADLGLDSPKATRAVPPPPKKPAADDDSSSEFELISFEAPKPIEQLGSGEIPLLDDDEVALGGHLSGGKGASGINLGDPADSGISLEGGGSDELEFDLSADLQSPASGASQTGEESSEFELSVDDSGTQEQDNSDSEFELTLDEPDPDSLKQDNSDSEFELTLDEGPTGEGSDSEFELSLDEGGPGTQENSDSEFELTLDESPDQDSSSEFELTLDADSDGGELSLEGPESSSESEFELSIDGDGDLATDGDEKDIFEPTNFDVPALEDDSASEAVALDEGDTDLETSDFDVSMNDDSESGSDVVALEDGEEADEGAATVAKPRKTKSKTKVKVAAEEEAVEDEAEAEQDEEDQPKSKKGKKGKRRDADEEEEEEEVEAESEAAPAVAVPWGPMPAILLFPTVIILFFVGIMTFELVQGMSGYHRPNKVSKPIIDFFARSIDENLPKD